LVPIARRIETHATYDDPVGVLPNLAIDQVMHGVEVRDGL